MESWLEGKRQRRVPVLKEQPGLLTGQKWKALLADAGGEVAAVPCRACKVGNPFTVCVMPKAGSVCSGCMFQNSPKRCDKRDQSEATPRPKARKAPKVKAKGSFAAYGDLLRSSKAHKYIKPLEWVKTVPNGDWSTVAEEARRVLEIAEMGKELYADQACLDDVFE
ncbi:hypothetical protein AAP_03380 [Ascosphaera apis ARSEF 7405]|uniref:Uncharacterized protein n=1 Tax=Ascosphaera apis ARSEF 7405 TaxID=392613 RepID=A0A166NN98_9EURO|nr:hypothetical protein AAP_03380 [Ascosphaera apis ARSEF 7405]